LGLYGGHRTRLVAFTVTVTVIVIVIVIVTLGLIYISLYTGRRVWLLGTWSILFVGAVFSAIHATAWNWEFPTEVERTLWRTITLFSTLICVQEAILLPFVGTGSKTWQRWTVIVWALPLWGLYMVMRAILLVQVFLSMRRMPDSVYQTVDWVAFLPHYG